MSTILAQDHTARPQEQASAPVPVWERAPDRAAQIAIDRVLAHMMAQGIAPRLQARGDIITATTQLTREFLDLMPASLAADANILVTHLIEWICDYCEQTGVRQMDMSFSFTAGAANT